VTVELREEGTDAVVHQLQVDGVLQKPANIHSL
jgi:hypothetical protein